MQERRVAPALHTGAVHHAPQRAEFGADLPQELLDAGEPAGVLEHAHAAGAQVVRDAGVRVDADQGDRPGAVRGQVPGDERTDAPGAAGHQVGPVRVTTKRRVGRRYEVQARSVPPAVGVPDLAVGVGPYPFGEDPGGEIGVVAGPVGVQHGGGDAGVLGAEDLDEAGRADVVDGRLQDPQRRGGTLGQQPLHHPYPGLPAGPAGQADQAADVGHAGQHGGEVRHVAHGQAAETGDEIGTAADAQHHPGQRRRGRPGIGIRLPPLGVERHLGVRRRRDGRRLRAGRPGTGRCVLRHPAPHAGERVRRQVHDSPARLVERGPVDGSAGHPVPGEVGQARAGRRHGVRVRRGGRAAAQHGGIGAVGGETLAQRRDVLDHDRQPLPQRLPADLERVGDVGEGRPVVRQQRGGVVGGRTGVLPGGDPPDRGDEVRRARSAVPAQVRDEPPYHLVEAVLVVGGQDDELRAGRRGRAGTGGWRGDDRVGDGPSGAERADARDPGAGPLGPLPLHPERHGVPGDVRVEFVGVQRRREHAVPQLQDDLGETGESGGGLGVPDRRLHRADRDAAGRQVGPGRVPVRPGQAVDLDRVAERRAGAVCLHVADLGGSGTGVAQRPPYHVGQRDRAGHDVAVRPSGVDDGGAADHGVHRVTVVQRPPQRLEDQRADPLGRHEPVAAGAEGPAAPVGRGELHPVLLDELVRVQRQADGPGHRQFGLAAPQALHRQVERDQRGGAHRVHGEARAVQVEAVRHPVGDAAERRAGVLRDAAQRPLRPEQRVLVPHRARVHGDRGVVPLP